MIYSMDDFGNEHCIVLISEGEFVGEMEALLNADRVVYSAKAYTDCELIAIPVGTFRWWIDTDAQALRRLTETLGRKLYSVSTQLARKASFDAMSRLILALEFFGGGCIDHTRQELADACSMSIRTINRCVRKLMDDRLISIERGKICISESQFNALRGLIRDSDPGVSAPAYARRRN
jgi:CRP-like cAMP-binding protein